MPRAMAIDDWVWWAWMATAGALTVFVVGYTAGLLVAIGLVLGQLLAFLCIPRPGRGFALQLRVAYLLILGVAAMPGMAWLAWVPMLGTWALCFFGYCLLARCLALLPWNREEALSAGYLRRVFFSPPDAERAAAATNESGCPGGWCTIRAQVAPAPDRRHTGSAR